MVYDLPAIDILRVFLGDILRVGKTITSCLARSPMRTMGRGDMQGAALVKQASPVAWQHINLHGRYEFRKQPELVNVDEIVRELAEIQIETEVVRRL
jgi:hypothetical protein